MAPNLLGNSNIFLAEATITKEDQKSLKSQDKSSSQTSPVSKEPQYK